MLSSALGAGAASATGVDGASATGAGAGAGATATGAGAGAGVGAAGVTGSLARGASTTVSPVNGFLYSVFGVITSRADGL